MRARGAVVVLLIGQAACLGSPSLVRDRTSDYFQVNSPGRVWATLSDGEQVVIDAPRVLRDTIFGQSDGKEVALAEERVTQVKVRSVSAFRTALIPAAFVVAIGTTLLLVKQDPSAPLPIDSTVSNRCRYGGSDVATCS